MRQTEVTVHYQGGGGYTQLNPHPLGAILEHIRMTIATWPAELAEVEGQPGQLIEEAPGRWR